MVRVETTKQEIKYVAIGFVLSMIHWGLCLIFFAALLNYTKQGIVGCVKALLIMTLRGLLSTAVSSNLTSIVQMEKWALLFFFVFYILMSKDRPFKPMAVAQTQRLAVMFMLSCMLTALVSCSYPVVSFFKSISYAVPFCAVLYAVSQTNKYFDWMHYLYWLLTPVMIASALTIPFSRFQITNGTLQGVINHPNLFGIVCAIYIVTALYDIMNHPERAQRMPFVMIGLAFLMIYLSGSRTAMISALLMMMLYYLSISSSMKAKVLLIAVCVLVIVGIYFLMSPGAYASFSGSVEKFIQKRENEESMIDSRAMLIEMSMAKYDHNIWLGSGFSVPFEEGFTDLSFSFDVTYETGNLPTAVLGDCGLLGSALFYIYLLYILFHTKRKNWILFFLPIILSLGEQAFFSTNNIAIFYYLFYGICLATTDSEVKSYDAQYYRPGL